VRSTNRSKIGLMPTNEETPEETPAAVEIRALCRRLFWLELWLTLLTTLLIVGGGVFWMQGAMRHTAHTLHASGKMGGDLHFASISDGLMIVTHLLGNSADGGQPAIATLPRPLVIADSGGGIIEAATLKGLVWYTRPSIGRGYDGRVRPPAPGTNLMACYYRLEFSEPPKETR